MGSTIKVTPDEIDDVAKKVVGPAYDKVQDALKKFDGTGDGAAAFGGSPAGQHLGELHASVKTVFVNTVAGVGEDLDAFKVNLHRTAAGWRDTEESNAERSQTLASHLSGTAASATRDAYQRTRTELGDKLHTDPSLQHPAGRGGRDAEGGPAGPHGGEQGPTPEPRATPTGEGLGAGGV